VIRQPSLAELELLEKALHGGWSVDDPRLRTLLAERPDWAAALAEGEEPPGEGRRGAEPWRADVTEEDRRQVAESLAWVRRRTIADARRAAGTRPRPRRGVVTVTLAAAALLLLALGAAFLRERTGASGEPEVQLLGPGLPAAAPLHCRTPSGAVTEYPPFRWETEETLAPGEEYLVVVRATDAQGAELARTRTRATSWSPEPLELERWPAAIHWTVQQLDDLGFPQASASAAAQRAPR
jgi:hypothetical protein